MGVEPVCKQLGMLPEDLVDDVVSVQVERGDGDKILGFATTQGVGTQGHDVTGADGLLTKLAEHDRRSCADEDQLDAVMRHGRDRHTDAASASNDWLKARRRHTCLLRPTRTRRGPGHGAQPLIAVAGGAPRGLGTRDVTGLTPKGGVGQPYPSASRRAAHWPTGRAMVKSGWS